MNMACTGHQRDWRPTSPDHECNRAQTCSHGVLMPRAMQEECVRPLCALVHRHIRFQHLKMLFVPIMNVCMMRQSTDGFHFYVEKCVLSRQSIQSVAISTSGITSVMSASGSV